MMIGRIDTLVPLEDLQLKVRFDGGKTVIYDVEEDIDTTPSYSPLITEPALFFQVQLDESPTYVYWSQDIDLPSDAIYEYGQEVFSANAEPDESGL